MGRRIKYFALVWYYWFRTKGHFFSSSMGRMTTVRPTEQTTKEKGTYDKSFPIYNLFPHLYEQKDTYTVQKNGSLSTDYLGSSWVGSYTSYPSPYPSSSPRNHFIHIVVCTVQRTGECSKLRQLRNTTTVSRQQIYGESKERTYRTDITS